MTSTRILASLMAATALAVSLTLGQQQQAFFPGHAIFYKMTMTMVNTRTEGCITRVGVGAHPGGRWVPLDQEERKEFAAGNGFSAGPVCPGEETQIVFPLHVCKGGRYNDKRGPHTQKQRPVQANNAALFGRQILHFFFELVSVLLVLEIGVFANNVAPQHHHPPIAGPFGTSRRNCALKW